MMIHGLKLVPTKDGYKTTILKGATASFKELNGRWFARFPRALEPYAWGDSLDEVVLKMRTKFFKDLAAKSRARRPIEAPSLPLAKSVSEQYPPLQYPALKTSEGKAMRRRRNPRQLIVAHNNRFAMIDLLAEQGRGFHPLALNFVGDASVESKGFYNTADRPEVIEVSIPVSIYTKKGVDDPATSNATLIFTIETVEEDAVGLTWSIVADESILEDDE